MIKKYRSWFQILLIGSVFILFSASCKKDSTQPVVPASKSLATLGLYELASTDGTAKRVYIPITQIGTKKITFYEVFDTGSSGMTIDATDILPASMITSSGIQVAGDSVNVNGITVTTQQATISYGDATGETQEYGNLAYAPVTIGDQNGNITTKRIPMFLYYKVIDVKTGKQLPAHQNDVFGVGPGSNYANLKISSPLSYLSGDNSIPGFKLALLNKSSFSTSGIYVAGLLTIGLVPDDLTSASGFIMHSLSFSNLGGYSPDIQAVINYGGKQINGSVLFDTGTPSISTIEDNGATSNESQLPANSVVSVTTNNGFTFQYTTNSTYNLTRVDKPSFTLDIRTIFSIDFFISNEFLMDYQNHTIGLKNN